jgi:hypothetical protein
VARAAGDSISAGVAVQQHVRVEGLEDRTSWGMLVVSQSGSVL